MAFTPIGPYSGAAGAQSAYDANQADIEHAMAAVQPGRMMSSPFAQGLQAMYARGGQGFRPGVREAYQRQIGRTSAMDEQEQLSALRRKVASGPGFANTAGSDWAGAQIRAQSADRAQQAMDRMMIAEQDLANQQMMQAGQLYTGLYGIEADLAGKYASISANRARDSAFHGGGAGGAGGVGGVGGVGGAGGAGGGNPTVPFHGYMSGGAGGPPPAGGYYPGQQPARGWKWLNSRGQMVSTPRTPWEFQQMQQERLLWESQMQGEPMQAFRF